MHCEVAEVGQPDSTQKNLVRDSGVIHPCRLRVVLRPLGRCNRQHYEKPASRNGDANLSKTVAISGRFALGHKRHPSSTWVGVVNSSRFRLVACRLFTVNLFMPQKPAPRKFDLA